MGDIRLKRAEKKDAPVVYDLLKRLACELGKEKDFNGSSDAIESYGFSDPPTFEVILALEGEGAVGFVLFFYEFSTWRGLPGIYVQDVFVAEQVRGRKVGERLMAAAVARGKERGAVYMRLAVHHGNKGGLGFYKRLGFEEVSGETLLLLEGGAFEGMTKEGI